jgi:Domain of unknown function (DUF4296)
MKASHLVILLLSLFAFSCIEKTKTPSGVIGLEKMEKVLIDVTLAEELVRNLKGKDTMPSVNERMIQEFDKIFSQHGITREDFRKSYEFYQSRPDLYKVIADSMNAEGTRIRNQTYLKMPIPPS